MISFHKGSGALWLLSLFVCLFSLVATSPLQLSKSTFPDYSPSSQPHDQIFNPILDGALPLEKRLKPVKPPGKKPPAVIPVSHYTQLNVVEQKNIRNVAEQILRKTRSNDLILFVGNSPSYFAPAIDPAARNVYAIPISSSKNVLSDTDTTSEQLLGYWNNVLGPILQSREFGRVIIVDKSKTGQSVDGFKRVFDSGIKLSSMNDNDKARLLGIGMWFINVVDPSSPDFNNPQTVPLLAKVVGPDRTFINKITGGVTHARIQPNYPRASWTTAPGLKFTANEKLESDKLIDSIIAYNTRNGGLVGSLSESKGTGKANRPPTKPSESHSNLGTGTSNKKSPQTTPKTNANDGHSIPSSSTNVVLKPGPKAKTKPDFKPQH